MKKTILSLLTFCVATLSFSQILTSTPTFVTDDFTGAVTIVYDATQGTAGLKDYVGTDGVYAHTGVITNTSSGNSDWKHAPAWGDNSAKYKLTSLGNNKWQLLITPNIAEYYGLTTGEIVQKMAFVFRNGLKTKEGKDVGGADIFLDVYKAGLNVSITNPENKATTLNSSETVTIAASVLSNIELFVNGTSVKTALSATSLSYDITYSQATDYTLVVKATSDSQSVYDTAYVCVPATVTTAARPSGAKDGINYSTDGVSATLVMYAPGKSNVFLIGDFNNWIQKNSYQLKKDGNYWWITITGLEPTKLYAFQYLVDGVLRVSDAYTELVLDPWNDKWINENGVIYPNVPAYPEGKTTGLVATLQATKPAYTWQITNFTMPNADNVVIYEMLLRDFTTEKSLEGAIAKLDYLHTLGVTAIELMPVQEFDGNNSWGYNPNHYFAPDKAYGTSNMYKKFIDECHKRDFAVILDMVFNQASGSHPFAALYWNSTTNKPAADNPWMNVDAPHLYSVLNDFNHSFAGTREYFKRVLQYWITEYKIDGYRMDLTKGFTQNSGKESSYDQSRVDYLTEYHNAVKAVNPNAMFILEHLVGGSEETTLANQGMYLWRNMNTAYNQSASGWNDASGYADFSGMNTFPRHWVGYAESHDEERNFYKAKMYGNGVIKTDSTARLNRVPLNVAFMALTPGPKMLWQFEEMGYDYSINSFGGRVDPKPSAWGWLNLALHKKVYDKCSKIISLKKGYSRAFIEGNFDLQISSSDWTNGKRIALTHSDLNMIMVGNFLPNSTTVYPGFSKTGIWYELLSGEILNVSDQNMNLQLGGGEVQIYTDRTITGVNNKTVAVDCTIYPSVTKGNIWIMAGSNIMSVKIFNMQGALQNIFYNTNTINASSLTTGMYLMEIDTEQGKSVQKFIKQ